MTWIMIVDRNGRGVYFFLGAYVCYVDQAGADAHDGGPIGALHLAGCSSTVVLALSAAEFAQQLNGKLEAMGRTQQLAQAASPSLSIARN